MHCPSAHSDCPDYPESTGGDAPTSGRAASPAGPAPGPGGRLNLLLSFGGWQSDSWADRLPTLLEPVGVHSLRARSACEAADLIRTYSVHVAVVDLRLPYESAPGGPGSGAASAAMVAQGRVPGACAPDEAGPKVLELLARLASPPPTIVVKRGRSTRDDIREMHHALRAGAFAAIDPPVHLEDMLRLMQRVLNRFYAGRWPGSAGAGAPLGC